jgi:hypothetical protein
VLFSADRATDHDQLPFLSIGVFMGKCMAGNDQLDQLSWQLSKHSLGPIDAISNEIMSRLGSAFSAVVLSLRQAANDQPLMTLLLAAQAGYLFARLGRRYARN